MKSFAKVIMLVTFILLLASPATYAANWQWVVSTEDTTTEIDISNIQKSTSFGTNYMKIWVKDTYNQAGVQKIIESRKKEGDTVNNYENLLSQIERMEFQYTGNSKMWRITSCTFYDTKGNALCSFTDKSSEWYEVIPGTIAEDIFLKAYKN